VGDRVAADEAEKERKRPVRIARELCVVGITLGDGRMFQCVRVVVLKRLLAELATAAKIATNARVPAL
jgi:hypothetical protein